jgi:signal peptidase I
VRAVLAAAASLVAPGCGHGLVGRYRAMASWAVVAAAVSLASARSIWFLALWLAVRFAAAIDAFGRVRAADRAGVRSDWAAAFIAIGLNIALTVGVLAVGVEAYRIPSASMAPTLAVGDRVLSDELSPRWGSIVRGELITFRYPCDPSHDYVKRVIAVAGESVEIRCNTVYVDGAPLASRLVDGAGCAYDDYDEYSGRWGSRTCSEYTETGGAYAYHVYHDAGRPERDAHPGAIAAGDPKDFPRLDGARLAPRCAPDAAQRAHQLPGSIVETGAAGPCERQLHYVVPPGHVFVLGDNRANSTDSRYWGAVPLDHVLGRVVGIWFSEGRAGWDWRRLGDLD